jgi:hypothetical protein
LFAILPIHFQTLLVKIGGQPKITQPRLQTKDIGSKINMPPPPFQDKAMPLQAYTDDSFLSNCHNLFLGDAPDPAEKEDCHVSGMQRAG